MKSVDEIIDRYDGQKSWLVMILQDVQKEYNYLPERVLEHVAHRLALPLSHVHQVTTFYATFSLKERGRYVIRVCDGTACHLRSGNNLLDQIKHQLGIETGQTTPDKVFSLEVVACLGTCALAPAMMVGSEHHGKMTSDKVRQVLAEYRAKAAAHAPCATAGAASETA